jgi:hypothetical protein
MTSRRLSRAVLLAVALCLGVGATGIAPASSADRIPSLRLVGGAREITTSRFPGEPVPLQLATHVGAFDGPFELRATRKGTRFDVAQVVPSGSGVRTVRSLPRDAFPNLDDGLPGFFVVTVKGRDGEAVARLRAAFCPAGYERTRINDRGPDALVYPQTGCFNTALTRVAVWGIEEGWGVSAPQFVEVEVPDGTFTVTVAIARRYREMFDIAPRHAEASLQLTVKTQDHQSCEHPDEPCEPPHPLTVAHATNGAPGQTPQVQEDAGGLPDLVALPAHRIFSEREQRTNRDLLIFAATVWNAGPGPLVVEGFRRPGRDLMDAYQYLFEDGTRIARYDAGTLEYDRRDGHGHWHFTDFARYRLVNAERDAVVRSGKEAFCLAPTDAVDLTIPTANWRPGSTGLSTACGTADSIWIREILDVGWGDTYIQSVPGQSFDITDVTNGTYLVEVATNPDRDLRESRLDNNVAYTKVVLGGRPGARTVKVRSR